MNKENVKDLTITLIVALVGIAIIVSATVFFAKWVLS